MMVLKRKNTLPLALIVVVLVVIAFIGLGSPAMQAPPAVNQMNTSTTITMGYDAAPMEPGLAAGEYNVDEEAQAPMDDGRFSDGDGSQRDRVILKTASLRLIVEAADSALIQITNMAEAMGGWVVTSSTSMVRTSAGQDVAQGSITIRVPAERLNEALTQIKSGGGEVDYESVSGQDVTQQYVDLSSRLTNLEAAETQLQLIMEDARRTEDVLSVYNQLVSTRGEIESIRGQLQYFEESATYSSISIDLIPKAIETPIQIAGWSPGRTIESALATLINVLQFGADILITAVVLGVPLLLVVGIPLWFVRRAWRRRAAAAATV